MGSPLRRVGSPLVGLVWPDQTKHEPRQASVGLPVPAGLNPLENLLGDRLVIASIASIGSSAITSGYKRVLAVYPFGAHLPGGVRGSVTEIVRRLAHESQPGNVGHITCQRETRLALTPQYSGPPLNCEGAGRVVFEPIRTHGHGCGSLGDRDLRAIPGSGGRFAQRSRAVHHFLTSSSYSD